MASILESVQGYRATQVDEHQGLLSKLKIGNNIYDIKDPAVEQLATFVDNAIKGVQGQISTATTFTEISKTGTQGRVATKVTQAANGQIGVEYGDVLAAGVNNTISGTQVLTNLSQNTTGDIVYQTKDLVASDVASTAVTASNTSIGISATNVQSAIEQLATGVQSAKADAITAAEAKVNELAGQDWSKNAKTVKDIIDELTGADTTATEAMITVADKLRDDFTYGEGKNRTTSVRGYIDGKFSELESAVTAVSVSAEGDELVSATTEDNGRTVVVGAQSALSDAVGYAQEALQTISGDEILIHVNDKSGSQGAWTSSIAPTTKLTTAVAAAETSLQTVTGETDANALIQVGGKIGEVGAQTTAISATNKLKEAVTKAEASLASNKVEKGTITYLESATYTSDSEMLEFTPVTNRNIVVPKGDWPNS